MHQSTTPSLLQTIWPRWVSKQFLTLLIVQTLLPVTFAYSLSSEAVVMRQLSRGKRLWRRSLTRSRKKTSMGPSRSCWNGTTSALQPEEITSKGLEFHVCTINKSAHTKKVWKLIVCLSYIDMLASTRICISAPKYVHPEAEEFIASNPRLLTLYKTLLSFVNDPDVTFHSWQDKRKKN